MSKKIIACVVLYNPLPEVIANINSYYPYVDSVIVIDNSANRNTKLEDSIKINFARSDYYFQNENTGIAVALNKAATIAIEKGYEWLLTMDQDSKFSGNSLFKMVDDICLVTELYDKTAIITPHHILANNFEDATDNYFSIRKIAMTSGNLLHLKTYQSVGKFDEKLFIDYVDYEYCLRLRKNNYKIVQNNMVKLEHSLGDFAVIRFIGKKVGVTNHNSIRRYYITRNGLYVGFKYFKSDFRFFVHMLYDNFLLNPLLILFYEKNKLMKLKAISKGVRYFLMGKYGK